MLLACELDHECRAVLRQHSHPPQFMVENLLDFLTPTCVGRCRNIISSFSKTRNTRLDQIVKLKRTMRDIPKNNKAQLASFKKKLNAHKDAIKVCGEALLVSLFNEMLRDGGFRANVDVIDGKQADGCHFTSGSGRNLTNARWIFSFCEIVN